jgi:hypothetical protein
MMRYLFGLIFLLFLLMSVFGPSVSLDTKLYYSGNEARALLENLGEAGRRSYFLNEWIDLAFIATYTCAFVLGLRRVWPGRRWSTILAIAPGVFDYIETISVLLILRLAIPLSWLDWLGTITLIKWLIGTVAVIFWIMGALRIRKLQSRTE